MSSKYNDLTSVLQVLGCVYKNPSLLEERDKYPLTDADFADEFHRATFGALFKLYELGAREFNLQQINDFFSTRPKYEAIYKLNKGDEWLLKTAETCTPTAFDYYYQRLKKFSLLRAYDNCGIDVSDIYDIDNILDVKKKQLQEEKLDNATLESIADTIDAKLSQIRIDYVNGVDGHVYDAAEDIEDLVDSLKEHPEVGMPLFGSMFNTVTRGARLRKFYLRSAATGTGKSIPDYAVIPTPSGPKRVGDIVPGDYIFGQDGKPTKILQIHPQPEEKEIFEVTFSDGRKAECCEEHLWEYRYQSHRGYSYRVESLREIINRTKNLKNGLKDSCGKGYRFHIRLNEPLEYEEKEFSLSPYAMGALLGDGSFRYTGKHKALSFSSENVEIPSYISKELGEDIYCTKYSEENYHWYFKNKNNPNHPLWVEEVLYKYPELWNLKSENKFIPAEYLMGSIEQRYELLKGLMDTDGSIDSEGRLSFTTVSEKLRDDFISLCRSLGFVANYLIDKREEKYTTGECYEISIQAKKELKADFFKLERKRNIALEYIKSKKRSEHKDHLAIVDITPTGRKTAMTCFTVDNESHLFLMNDYIVTHNTRSMIADACYIACEKIYNQDFGWINTHGCCASVLFITTEQDITEIQTMMLAFISDVNEEHILQGKYEGDEEERIKIAIQILKNAKLYVKELPDFSLQDVEDTIKTAIREQKVSYVFK